MRDPGSSLSTLAGVPFVMRLRTEKVFLAGGGWIHWGDLCCTLGAGPSLTPCGPDAALPLPPGEPVTQVGLLESSTRGHGRQSVLLTLVSRGRK